ncbi:MAG TPA: ABC transporter ATP-binding protein [Dermatophilaceae bacterium]|jgi:putative ABC transport system ATP-binding protein|nr:ABC transporter ATP-binding protein [Dermatophilaceae bacterium]
MEKPPVLMFDEVTRLFAGPPEVTALRDCSVSIHAGDLVTVCGPSGSGKSTWLSLAGLMDRPTSGKVTVNGVDTTDLGEDDRTAVRGQWIGLVFQSFHLMPRRTVRENIELAGVYRGMRPGERRRRALELADRVGLGPRASSLANTLSGGEMQRTAIARALMGAPLVILCDEPTGNLDSANGHQVMTVLADLNTAGTTVVIITHDPRIAAAGRRRLSVLDGVLTEQ